MLFWFSQDEHMEGLVSVGTTVNSHIALVSEMSIIHHTNGSESEAAWLAHAYCLAGVKVLFC